MEWGTKDQVLPVFLFFIYFFNEMQLKEKMASFRFIKETGFKPDMKVIVPW